MTSLPQQFEVLVTGAGPAGTASARALALAGHSVLLIDQVQPVEKCGQCLSATARPLLEEIGLLPWLERSAPEICQRGFSSWGDATLQECEFMEHAFCGGWHLNRRRFDTCLRASAIAAGAQFLPSRLQTMEKVGRHWRCQLQDGMLKPFSVDVQWIIDASGRRAQVAQTQGIARLQDESLVALYASGNNANFDTRSLIEAIPCGWWYSAAVSGERRLAVLHVDGEEATHILRQPGLWQEYLRATHHISPICKLDDSWCAPHGVEAGSSRLEQVYGEAWLAVGDAALSFDPLATQGIVAALDSGWRGGQALLAHWRGETQALAAYQTYLQQVRQTHRRELLLQYQQENRWPDQFFWASRHHMASLLNDDNQA